MTYDFDLPQELIAQQPMQHRADARLLLVDRQRQVISEAHVRDLGELMRPEDCLVINDTRVLLARLVGIRTATGGRWQGLYLEQNDAGHWRILGRTRGKLQLGETITLYDRTSCPDVQLTVLARQEGGVWVVKPQTGEATAMILERCGRVPLPPYIRGGEMEPRDMERYQTVFAARPGAVAAPTAGLHFTPQLLEQLQRRGVGVERVTLHVGIGTFRPLESEVLETHKMHAEWGALSAETAQRLRERRAQGGRLVAVGTTVVRVLETAAAGGSLAAWEGYTRLFIRPPHIFRAVDTLLTNFHLPRSTLLVLVRTFGGDELLRRAYDYAIEHRFRFFSYGDAMLIL